MRQCGGRQKFSNKGENLARSLGLPHLISISNKVSHLCGVFAVVEDAVEVDPLELDVAQQRPHGETSALEDVILADLQQLAVAGNAAHARLQTE